ncbi:protein isoform a [Moniliophthora roreri MCA 2997]|uniref:Protein isoform a n=1 Tax=Moniliophthora roreri (strain MCA 2997) TaxID=1381753 RepID=V2XM89_MONRO|nr:protein isoform a [Moniliophthora roreri MCA 2997]
MAGPQSVVIACDRGGTFSDIWAFIPRHLYKSDLPASLVGNAVIVEGAGNLDGVQVQLKLLSEDPVNYQDTPTEGIRRILQIFEGREIHRGEKIDTKLIDSVRMGTTVATNALLERKGEPFGLVMTKGFGDLLEIGDQTRPDLFDLSISTKPSLLYHPDNVIEVEERVTMEGWTLDPEGQSVESLLANAKQNGDEGHVKVGLSGEVIRILKPLDEQSSACYTLGLIPAHEQRIARIAKFIRFTQISLSSEISPAIKAVPRGNAAAVDAYLSPVVRRYVQDFLSNFVDGKAGKRCDFMQSDGALVSAEKFSGLRAVLSGPAGGVVGFAKTTHDAKSGIPIIGFDMGGTSTDVSRFAGQFEHNYDHVIAGIKVACPQLGIETVAAGGGSRLTSKNGTFCVGPESVGAHPGPVCYRKGGQLAITDANLVLGRLHACFIAKGLGIGLVVVPQFSSVLSAYGIACADVTVESAGPFFVNLSTSEANDIRVKVENRVFELQEDVCHKLAEQDVRDGDTDYEITVGCSYDRSDTVLQIPFSRSIKADFIAEHLRETSFSMPRDVLINSIRVRGTGRRYNYAANGFADGLAALESSLKKTEDIPSCYQNAYFESEMGGRRVQTPVFTLSDTLCGSEIPGPAIIADKTQAIVVEPDCVAKVLSQHVVIRIGTNQTSNKNNINEAPLVADPIMLAVFGNRFMSIAEQMGHTLQRTSISVSIKASVFVIFNTLVDTDGSLVANAPHIPVHLGSMQYAVQSQHRHWLGKLRPGDVLLTNHPEWGGTHLPDLTVVTPVFNPEDDNEILFYVASRGHHTDIGGTSVTSMNPISKELWQEGVSVKTFLLCSKGEFNENRFRELFAEPGKYPGSSATRRIDHNITDAQAAISANVRGATLMKSLFEEFGVKTVQFYMNQIQSVAAQTVRTILKSVRNENKEQPLRASDFMDDGTITQLEVRINPETGDAVFDWTGTGPQTHGNFNSPISLSYAAIIYSLRCMITSKIPMPLNQGVLDPIENIVPKGGFLNPTGVVAISGSTISSQRLVDVILHAFSAAAASQGCANSLGFGTGGKDAYGNVTPGFAYGEAIGGGSGTGPTWHGSHAISVHSTNTRLTDVEVIEA